MTANEFKAVLDFEGGLSAGDTVRVNWTNSGLTNTSLAIVLKSHQQSFTVSLLEHVSPSTRNGCGYPIGHKVKVPRLNFGGTGLKLWRANNRLEPVEGYSQNG